MRLGSSTMATICGENHDPLETLNKIAPRQRNYDPAVGAWAEQDSTGYVDGPDLYAFAELSPVSQTDPQGTQSGNPNPPTTAPTDWSGWTQIGQPTKSPPITKDYQIIDNAVIPPTYDGLKYIRQSDENTREGPTTRPVAGTVYSQSPGSLTVAKPPNFKESPDREYQYRGYMKTTANPNAGEVKLVEKYKTVTYGAEGKAEEDVDITIRAEVKGTCSVVVETWTEVRSRPRPKE